MIYFIKDTMTLNVKIGYSKNPKKRLAHLQTATPNALILLGTIPGGLEHEATFHEKFSPHKLQGEWFNKNALPEVLAILAKEAANPQQVKMNVIVSGDSDSFFVYSSDQQQMANRNKLEALVAEALSEIHAKTPISWVITGGERLHDRFAWDWATKNKVEIYRYYPNWSKHGRFAGFKTGPLMLRSMFDPKTLLVFLSNRTSKSTADLIRRAEKARIPVVKKGIENRQAV